MRNITAVLLFLVYLLENDVFKVVCADGPYLTLSSPDPVLSRPMSMECDYRLSSAVEYLSLDIKKGSAVVSSVAFCRERTFTKDSIRITTELRQNETRLVTNYMTVTCEDMGFYTAVLSYFDQGSKTANSLPLNISVKANPVFGATDSHPIVRSPNTDLRDGDSVTLTCTGNVGGQPAGQLRWYLYQNSSATGKEVDSSFGKVTSGQPKPAQNCSFTRTSELQFKFYGNMTGSVLRCTVQQDTLTSEGEGFKEMILHANALTTTSTTTTTTSGHKNTTTSAASLLFKDKLLIKAALCTCVFILKIMIA